MADRLGIFSKRREVEVLVRCVVCACVLLGVQRHDHGGDVVPGPARPHPHRPAGHRAHLHRRTGQPPHSTRQPWASCCSPVDSASPDGPVCLSCAACQSESVIRDVNNLIQDFLNQVSPARSLRLAAETLRDDLTGCWCWMATGAHDHPVRDPVEPGHLHHRHPREGLQGETTPQATSPRPWHRG